MNSIEVQNLPDDAYQILLRRAQQAGKSLEAYTRDESIALAARPTKHEAIEQIEAILKRTNPPNPTMASILEDLKADRRGE